MRGYFNELGVSQSFLKGVLKNSFKKEDSASLQRGTLIDHFVFGGDDLKSYDGDINKYCTIATECADLDHQTILAKVRELKYNDNYKDETHLNNIAKIQPFLDYFTENKGQIYTRKEIELSKMQAKQIIDSPQFQYLVGEENLYQLPLFGVVKDVRIKGLLDWVSVNHTKKHIKLIDLKTTHYPKPDMFAIACKEYRYDFQMAFYKELIEQNYPGYSLDCYWLIYTFKKVACWKVSEEDLLIGKLGTEKTFATFDDLGLKSKFFISGWVTALDTYIEALDKEYPDYDVKFFQNNGFYKGSIYS